jgi:hypothetical protein
MDQRSNINATVENYFDMWNETDRARRRALVEAVWVKDAQSIDPLADVRGWDAIEQLVAGVQQQYPGHRIRGTGAVDQHHDRLRFPWSMQDPNGQTVLTGIDCVRLAGDGRFAELVGFFDGAVPGA